MRTVLCFLILFCPFAEIDDSKSRALYQTQIIEGHSLHCCTVCQYHSRNIGNMKRHVRTHTGERPFSCPHCGQRFKRKENVQLHILTFHVQAKCCK
ncbi:hypothetical protein AVEN_265610-1 [Araneus ventricosus]|uniref:C2H2-type domain-containing protein n=1 Tax=Araneus ventricosus TaxID=182803 RepID=A0A4Y2IZ17_ARAVE|nr:hypothetical protein AVEN_265610-1 [Araneus ventricosus]